MVAARLGHLIAVVQPRDRGPCTDAGTAPEQLAAVAGFFGVSPAYFIDAEKAAEIDRQLRLVKLIRDTGAGASGCAGGAGAGARSPRSS